MRLAIGAMLFAASLAAVGNGAGQQAPISRDRPPGDISLGFPDCNNNGIDDTVETTVEFTEIPIASGANSSIDLADLDGDTDLDLLAAGIWYENIGGNFSLPGHVIPLSSGSAREPGLRLPATTGQSSASGVLAADVDGDGDLDVLRWGGSIVVWHENLNGQGQFGPASDDLFTDALGQIESFDVIDFSSDADNDLLAPSTWHDASVDHWLLYGLVNDGTGLFSIPGEVYTKAQHEQDFQEGGGDVHVADIDGDGVPDVITRWGADTELEWLGNGVHPIASVAGSRRIRAADFDGDQDNDVLYGERWFENVDGVGTFGPPQVIGGGESLWTLPSDVNGDGDVDVLAKSTADDTLEWLENVDGLGSFGPRQVISSVPGLEDFLAGDLNGDYTTDVAVASSSSGLSWYRNESGDCNANQVPDECDVDNGPDCNGNSVPDDCDVNTGSSPDCNGNGVPDACDLGSGTSLDLNGNGFPDECEDCNNNGVSDDLDLAGGTSMDCNENYFPDECEDDCNGSGRPDDCDVDSGTSADCNSNGVPDECDLSSGTSADCNSNGVPDECDAPDCDGNGVPDECDPDCNGNSEPDGCDIANGISEDCDGDGVPDECQLDAFAEHNVVSDVDGTRSVFAVDLDGDGDNDVLSASEAAGVVAWYENTDGAGTFGPPRVIAGSDGEASSVVAADLDDDGDADVVAAFADVNTVAWYENTDGAGTFGIQQPISILAADVRSVAVADLDGDGDIDVLSASSLDEKVAWYANNDGLGGFGAQIVLSVGGLPVWVSAADLDSDGDQDILAALNSGDEFVWYRNEGFLFAQQHLADAESAQAVIAADLDGDGDSDVVTAHQNTISWLENLGGAGAFGAMQLISPQAFLAQSVFAADLDGDGDRDVLSASSGDETVAWYENTDGLGTFGLEQAISTSANDPTSVVAIDLDGDADVDVLSASWAQFGTSKVDWYENLGDDCDGNGIGDSCDPDCNANGIADACDIRFGSSNDCDGNGAPDECDAGCGSCDADGDGCLDATDLDPGDANVCGDVDADTCDDCSSGIFDPENDGTNSDTDGICDAGDCDPFNNEVWYEPSAVTGVVVSHSGTTTTLSWPGPEVASGLEVRYDTLRSSQASDFVSGGVAICIETDEADQSASDDSTPASGEVYHYLIRIENDCPGDGNLGTDSDDVPRVGLACI